MRGFICGLVIGALIQWYTDRPTAPAQTVAPSPAVEEDAFDDLFEDEPFAREYRQIPKQATIWSPDNPDGYRQYKPPQEYPIIVGDPKKAHKHLSR